MVIIDYNEEYIVNKWKFQEKNPNSLSIPK